LIPKCSWDAENLHALLYQVSEEFRESKIITNGKPKLAKGGISNNSLHVKRSAKVEN